MFAVKEKLTKRAEELFEKQQREIYLSTDRLFARLMLVQWLAAILMAVIISPYTWTGQTSAIHIHVWAAIFLGGAISLFPIWMTRAWPGAAITRHVVAVAQMLMSALLISVTGGRIETHFHVFVSLVILSFYRDWRVLIPATIVVGLDHFLRGIYWPYSVYGVLAASPWRSIEHAVWVVFEDIFLFISCRRSICEMGSIANRTAKLEASEESFRRIFDEAPIGAAIADPDYRFVKVNAAMCKMVGYSEQELTNMRSLEITFPEDVDLTYRNAQLLLRGASGCSFEKRYIRKDKQVIWVTCEVHPIEFENNTPRYYLGMLQDITERKRAEEALQELNQVLDNRVQERTAELQTANCELQNEIAERKRAENALHETNLALGNAMPGISILNSEGRYERVNEAYAEMMRYSITELVGMDWMPTVVPEDRKQALEAYQQMLAEGKAEFDARAVRKDGSQFYKHVLMVKRIDPNGKVLGHYCFMRDITDRKKAETALREAEQKYRAIFENAVEGMFQTTPEGKYISVNPALARMYGYSTPEELRASVTDIAHVLYVDPERRNEFKRLIETEGFVEGFEFEVYRRDGTRVWFSENARAVRDANGAVLYYEGAVQDITERKRVDEVERASKAKSEFLSRMSHELRTPLNAILGFGQLLERQKPTEVQRKRIGYILNAGKHLLDLINEVLDISRIEAGRMQLSLEPVCVADALEETLDLMRPLATERTIKLSASVDIDAGVHVLADRQRFKQVLLNLLNNAVKYTPFFGGVTVSYSVNGNDKVRVLVSDTGPGIPAEKLARLFTPFERLGAEQSAIEGTGLGLALSQRLMQAMGGSIGVDSAVGKGSTFWIELPQTKSPLEQLPLGKENNGAGELGSDSVNRSILYIEDNLSNLALIEQMLAERPGTALLTTTQGKVGLDLARGHTPDLILLDLHLPDLAGWDVLSQLKADARTRHIPVVVISADATKRQINRLMTVGAAHYLTKPLDITKFFRVLDETTAICGTELSASSAVISNGDVKEICRSP